MRNEIQFGGAVLNPIDGGVVGADCTNLTTEFGCYCNGDGTYGAPARRVTLLEVPGRSGLLSMEDGSFDNISVSYRCFIRTNFENNIRRLRNFLETQTGYRVLKDSYHPEEYRLGVFSGPFDPVVRPNLKSAEFTLTFNCMPQRFLFDGLNPHIYTASDYLQNPWRGTARPYIRIYGTGRVVINGRSIVVNSNEEYTDIDCEAMDCFEGSENRNPDTVLASGFPVLSFGSNRVFIQTGGETDNVSVVQIVPRWWRL